MSVLPTDIELVTAFTNLFGAEGGDCFPGNVGRGRLVVETCNSLMTLSEPVLFDYFDAWERRADESRPLHTELHLARIGQWEGAWSLARLHYDQVIKEERRLAQRRHKGHPLCNLAIVAREIGSHTLERTFALLSSAGDVYWEHVETELMHGGYGLTMVEQFESVSRQIDWRASIRAQLAGLGTSRPTHLEQFLVRRWFGQSHFEHIAQHTAEIQCASFLNELLNAVEHSTSAPATERGTLFEAAAGWALSLTPGFEIDASRSVSDEQTDLVFRYTPDRLSVLGLSSVYGLVECKSSTDNVGAKELRDFGAKCMFHRVPLGIMVARKGISGSGGSPSERQHAELVRRRLLADGLTVLVLTFSQLRSSIGELRGLQHDLETDHRVLVFGPVV